MEQNHPLNSLRIVFFGTPEFAAYQLKFLMSEGFNIVAVVTAPDKPKGRGKKMLPSEVKNVAQQLDIPVIQPVNLKSDDFLDELNEFAPDMQIIVAFRMLPEKVWELPPMGTINLHASYLPNYRGAAPINRCIMNGETETGISTFILQHKIDTGDILIREKVAIKSNWNAGDLYQTLMEKGAPLIKKTILGVLNGSLNPLPQKTLLSEISDKPKHAPKIFKEDMKINWDTDVHKVHNLIRGLSPYPGAFFTAHDSKTGNDIAFKVFQSTLTSSFSKKPGDMQTDGKNLWKIQCKNGAIAICEVQMQGKNRVNISEFLRGFDVNRLM